MTEETNWNLIEEIYDDETIEHYYFNWKKKDEGGVIILVRSFLDPRDNSWYTCLVYKGKIVSRGMEAETKEEAMENQREVIEAIEEGRLKYIQEKDDKGNIISAYFSLKKKKKKGDDK